MRRPRLPQAQPNRPIDNDVAHEIEAQLLVKLKRGEERSLITLHKGACRKDAHIYHGDHQSTRYVVLNVTWPQPEVFELTIINHHSFEVFHLTPSEAAQYHRETDCAGIKRRPPKEAKKFKPNERQQIVIFSKKGLRKP